MNLVTYYVFYSTLPRAKKEISYPLLSRDDNYTTCISSESSSKAPTNHKIVGVEVKYVMITNDQIT